MKQWVCSKCSSRNGANMKFCHVCHIPRPAVPLLPQDVRALKAVVPPAELTCRIVHRPMLTAQAVRHARSILIMKLLVLFNLAVLGASLIGLIVLKGR